MKKVASLAHNSNLTNSEVGCTWSFQARRPTGLGGGIDGGGGGGGWGWRADVNDDVQHY